MLQQHDPVADRLRGSAGLAALVAEAEATWRSREAAATRPDDDDPIAAGLTPGDARPGWRTFEDAFPTFYEFTNRPR